MKPPRKTTIFVLFALQPFCAWFVDSASLRRAQEDENHGPATTLTSGVATPPLDFSAAAESKLFVVEGITLGDTVACVTDADEGDIDLFVHFNTPPVGDPDGDDGIHTCDSIEANSEEACVVKATDPDQHSVYVLLRAYTETENATLTCTVTPLTTLIRGVSAALSVDREHDALFQLAVEAGESVECIASGEKDVDLYLGLGTIPDPRDFVYDCRSAGSNNQTETCAEMGWLLLSTRSACLSKVH